MTQDGGNKNVGRCAGCGMVHENPLTEDEAKGVARSLGPLIAAIILSDFMGFGAPPRSKVHLVGGCLVSDTYIFLESRSGTVDEILPHLEETARESVKALILQLDQKRSELIELNEEDNRLLDSIGCLSVEIEDARQKFLRPIWQAISELRGYADIVVEAEGEQFVVHSVKSPEVRQLVDKVDAEMFIQSKKSLDELLTKAAEMRRQREVIGAQIDELKAAEITLADLISDLVDQQPPDELESSCTIIQASGSGVKDGAEMLEVNQVMVKREQATQGQFNYLREQLQASTEPVDLELATFLGVSLDEKGIPLQNTSTE